MKKISALIAICLLLLIQIACQPTPEEEVVVQRDGVILEEKIHATPKMPEATEDVGQEPEAEEEATSLPTPNMDEICKAQLEAYKATLPEHWNDYMETSYIKITIDADIVVTNEDSFPVYTVKRGKYDMQKLSDIANKMIPGVTGIREGDMPLPSEYEEAIASLADRGMTEYAKYLFDRQQETEEGSYTETDGISFSDAIKQEWVVKKSDGTSGHISISGNMVRIRTRLEGAIHLQEVLELDGSYQGEGPVYLSPSITQEQAEAMLETFLRENGLEGLSIQSASAARYFTFLTREEISQGWQFELVRGYGYYPIDTFSLASKSQRLRLSAEDSYGAAWSSENMRVYISENGVEYLQWSDPLEILECVNPCVELLEFEEVQNNLKRLLILGVSWTDSTVFQPTVTKIVLAAAPQQIKDQPGKAYLMPIWVAFLDWHYLDEGVVFTEVVGINAIDSSRAILAWE